MNIDIDKTKIPFGKHKGKPLDQVPLRYLDWLLSQEWLFADLKQKITKYLKDPAIAQELQRELEEESD